MKVQIKKTLTTSGIALAMLKYRRKTISVVKEGTLYRSHAGKENGGSGWLWSIEDFTIIRRIAKKKGKP